MMDFDTMIDHIEQLQAENDAEDALDEQRLQVDNELTFAVM